MIDPPSWTEADLAAGILKSRDNFSRERLEEPLEFYLDSLDEYQGYIEDFLELTVDLSLLEDCALEILCNSRLLEVFRYLAGPPISEDDLKVLAETTSLSRSELENEPHLVRKLITTVRTALDRRRFAWVGENREPTEAERKMAVMASAALIAASRTQTRRRHLSKEQQEAKVKDALTQLGFQEVPPRKIGTISHAPEPGTFCGECKLGNRKGDIIVRLWDQRLMPIECKVSNSSTNSVKRLNNDAAVKASTWRQDFGMRQVVPSAVLSGVYRIHNLIDAQDRGLTIFWAHDLEPLTAWIAKTR